MTPFGPEHFSPILTCVGGGAVGADGVCIEHGETACVIGLLPAETPKDPALPDRESGVVSG